MTNKEIKIEMIDALFQRGEWIKQVNPYEYRTRCPYCGDSTTNAYTGHLYIRIDPEDNLPILWNCFKCNEHGVVNEEFLSMMNIEDLKLKSSIISLNKTSDKLKSKLLYDGTKIIFNNYKIPEIDNKKYKIKYLEERLGADLSSNNIADFKIITSLKDFLKENNIKSVALPIQYCKNIEDHYIGFLSYGMSYILFRDITDTENMSWVKYPITEDSKMSKCFYTISSEINILTEDTITVNLSEGIMDILSCYKNLGFNKSNTLNIAVCGKRYDTIINYLIELGLIGNNIEINIFADNDEKYNKKAKNPTDIKYFKRVFYNYKHFFGKINVYYNLDGKDIGVPKEQIRLIKKMI